MSWTALALTILPSLLFFCGWDWMSQARMEHLMMAATVGWFVATPLWMGHDKPKLQESETLP